METAIIESMGPGMFLKNTFINPKILNEVPFFKKILQDNMYNTEVFHGYINKINDTWSVILSSQFKKLIKMYNEKYIINQIKERERQTDMINMANAIAAEQLYSDLENLSVSPSLSSITSGLSRSAISKKRPSKKLRK
tara:strand:+ start:200 stop:613 length:414 start_codon:yes stop_codon:yes gene_type:complete